MAASHYPFVVMGAGPAGLLLTSLLRQVVPKSIPIALINNNKIISTPTEKKIAGTTPDIRNYALSPASMNLVKQSGGNSGDGAWSRMLKKNAVSFYDKMQVWESSGTGIIHFDSTCLPSTSVDPVLGGVVEDRVLCAELAIDIVRGGGVDFLAPVNVSSIERGEEEEQGLTIEMDDGRAITAGLLFACDGANSFAKENATDIRTKKYPYNRKALICTVKVSESYPQQHSNIAFQRFFKNGPIALLPLHEHYRSIVWSTTEAEAQALTELEEDEFLNVLNDRLRTPPSPNDFPELSSGCEPPLLKRGLDAAQSLVKTIGTSLSLVGMNEGEGVYTRPPKLHGVVSPRFSLPLTLSFAEDYSTNDVVLVGDAAHTVHPMAGQGLNLGIGDVAKIIELVEEGVQTGQGMSSLGRVMETHYNRERKLQCAKVQGGIHLLHEIFSSDVNGFVHARGIGLGLVNMIAPAKRLIVQEACGVEIVEK